MTGGGAKTRPINWPLWIQVVGTGFTILCVVLGGLMAYAYMNGGVQRSLQDHERRIDANERKIADLERQQRGLSNTR